MTTTKPKHAREWTHVYRGPRATQDEIVDRHGAVVAWTNRSARVDIDGEIGRTIAASPNLLTACELLLPYAEDGETAPAWIIETARNAIAKTDRE